MSIPLVITALLCQFPGSHVLLDLYLHSPTCSRTGSLALACIFFLAVQGVIMVDLVDCLPCKCQVDMPPLDHLFHELTSVVHKSFPCARPLTFSSMSSFLVSVPIELAIRRRKMGIVHDIMDLSLRPSLRWTLLLREPFPKGSYPCVSLDLSLALRSFSTSSFPSSGALSDAGFALLLAVPGASPLLKPLWPLPPCLSSSTLKKIGASLSCTQVWDSHAPDVHHLHTWNTSLPFAPFPTLPSRFNLLASSWLSSMPDSSP